MVESSWEHYVLLTNLVRVSSSYLTLLGFNCYHFILVPENFKFVSANAVLEGACERAIVGDLYCDIPLGLYIIRGENVVLIGELV